MSLGKNRDPIYAPDGRTWYETALAEAEKRGNLRHALLMAESALADAECVIDADDQPETFNKVAAARKLALATL